MTNPPTGTVTFLFTDIEGSTKLWEAHPSSMKEALQRHDTLLREAVEANNGYVFKTVGDACCAAFPTAVDALNAVLSAQSALRAIDWGEIGPLKVRAGLHTGIAQERDGDYFGPTVNRVARLQTAGHGGQTLLSLPTYELARDHLPPGVELQDMGEHRLKDLLRPERLFQVVAPGMASGFPPLQTLDTHPNNLPLQPTPLIGREKEVDEVRQRLSREDVRLLTLTGPGGTGKTRLSLQVAAELVDRFEAGVYFVNLAPISDPGLVVSTVAQTLGVKEAGDTPLIQTLKTYLHDRQMLLLLDNFEQVVEAAPAIAELVSSAPSLKVLVTSRARLQVSGEKEYPVPPLSLPDPKQMPSVARLSQYEAVRLFIERAQDVKPHFEVTNGNAPAIAEICARLDGLPLAIELAAARIKVLPPQAILARLQSRLKLLTGGGRDLTARQQTLRGAIEWSYDLLSDEEKKLFRRLAVFVGGRSLEAIEAVCNADGDLEIDVLDGVSSLIDKSLLRQEEGAGSEPRFVMLETIHELAREKLEESGEAEAIKRQHADYFLDMAENAHDRFAEAEQPEWLDRLEVDHDNLRAAINWAEQAGQAQIGLRLVAAMRQLWWTRGYLGEGRERVATALAVDHEARYTLARAYAIDVASSLAWAQTDFDASSSFAATALEIFRELGDKLGMARSLHRLGSAAGYRGDHVTEAKLSNESLDLYRQVGSQMDVANQLVNVGCSANALGDTQRARALIEQGLAIFKELGSKSGMGFALENLGEVAHQQGDYDLALKLWEESASLYKGMGNKRWISTCLCYLAAMENLLHGPERAIPLFRESLLLAQEIGYKHGIAECLSCIGGVAISQERPERAVRLLAAAEAVLASTGATFYMTDRIEHERHLRMVHAQLGEATLKKAWQEGQATSMEQAIEYALEENELAVEGADHEQP